MEPEESKSPPLPPRPRKISRPKLNIPAINIQQFSSPKSPIVQIPMTAGCAIPIGNANGPFGLLHFYPSKASEYMNRRYEGFKDFTKNTAKAGLSFGEKSLFWLNGRIRHLSKKWFTHIFLFMIVFLYSLLGAFLFQTVEGTHEKAERIAIENSVVDFIHEVRDFASDEKIISNFSLWEENFRKSLELYQDQLLRSFREGITPQEHKTWSFWNALFYCGTIYTTIGYGHISPSTSTGRAITIIYAVFGIPMFLILLADFGKLFTRIIKFVWAFVRRLYYTGSCRKVRKTAPVQEMMKGVQIVYDFAKNRRPSQMTATLEDEQQQAQLRPPDLNPETPSTPALSTYEVDDEFNLPISVAISILLIYIFIGATIYSTWEEWTFFESFYFVFISMSTIGFGDFVPQHPMYMMASIVYLIFGLALTSMCINVVQEKLSDTFRQASVKIGTTIGLKVEDDGSMSAPAELTHVNPLDEESK